MCEAHLEDSPWLTFAVDVHSRPQNRCNSLDLMVDIALIRLRDSALLEAPHNMTYCVGKLYEDRGR